MCRSNESSADVVLNAAVLVLTTILFLPSPLHTAAVQIIGVIRRTSPVKSAGETSDSPTVRSVVWHYEALCH